MREQNASFVWQDKKKQSKKREALTRQDFLHLHSHKYNNEQNGRSRQKKISKTY